MIAFLTDYGTLDGFPAVCHGVMARIAPGVRVLDISHDVPSHDIRHGSRVLARAAEHLPEGTVYVAVVDPGVGTSRRGIAIKAGRSILVGPDNGLLPEAAGVLGGIDEARELANAKLWLTNIGATFHGRDIFAPVGAHLAGGRSLADVGPAVDAATVVRLPQPQWTYDNGTLTADVTYLDGFGNVQLAASGELLTEIASTTKSIEVRRPGEPEVLKRARLGVAFGDVRVGELVVYTDSDSRLALAVNSGRAADLLNVRAGDTLRLSPPDSRTR